jgi:CRISPR-associated endonuclease/helicase Cas3
VTDVYRAWCGLVAEHAGWIRRVAERHHLTVDRLLQSSLLCVALHDVGKLAENFQAMMRAPQGDAKAYRAAVGRNYRHEIAALWFVDGMARAVSEQFGPIPGGGVLEVLAVAGHHKYLADDFLFAEERFLQVLEWKPDAWCNIKAAYGLAEAMFKAQGWAFPNPKFKRGDVCQWLSSGETNYPFECLKAARVKVLQEAGRGGPSLRELFVLLKGLLMTADWMASGAAFKPALLDARRSVIRVASHALADHLKAKVEKDREERPQIRPFAGYRRFQTDCGEALGHVLAIAPTGSGKTEAALLWALRQVEAGHARKLLFLLPTMVTANSLYRRAKAFFTEHGHAVGLVHSTADLLGDATADPGEAEADRGDVRAQHLSTTHLFLPATVATVDQLLVTLFHAGRWALKTLAAADAAIVIDEVHAYDPHTTGLIALLLRQLQELGARFLVMSATMPTNLQNTILDGLEPGASTSSPGNIRVVKDAELLGEARNTWAVCDRPLLEWLTANDSVGEPVPSRAIREFLGEIKQSGDYCRVLIVVNTVKRCQEIARRLAEFQPVCFHSKFIFRDRREKERQIEKALPRLLVATQVVEVSLDIDYDILLTECAPFDALVQRAGRVNRSRRTTPGRVIVFPFEAGSEKVYGEPAGILSASWNLCQLNQRLLKESDLTRLVEDAYMGRALSEEAEFRGIQAETRGVQRRLAGVLDNPRPEEDDLKTRLEKYHQVSVIPAPLAGEARRCPPWDRRLFELKMPIWYVRQHKSEQYSEELPLCKMQYDAHLGGRFLPTKEAADPGCVVF